MDARHTSRSGPVAARTLDTSGTRARNGAKSSNKKAAGHKQGRASGSSNSIADTATKATAPAPRRNLSNFVTNNKNHVMSDDYEVGQTPFDNRGEFPQALVDAMHRKQRGAKRKEVVEEEIRMSSR
jgi:hypothetical protein